MRRFAIRQLRKSPGLHLARRSVTLALGMCASVAIFAFVDAALIKPLPYPNPSRLVGVYRDVRRMFPQSNLSYADYLDWKRLNNVFTSLAVYQARRLHVEHPRRRATRTRRAGERRLLSHARRRADARARFPPGEDLPAAAPHRHPQLRRLAEAIRRPAGRSRADGDAERRAERHHRRPAAATFISRPPSLRNSGRRSTPTGPLRSAPQLPQPQWRGAAARTASRSRLPRPA